MSHWSCCLIIFVAVFVSLGSSKVINLPDSKNQTLGDYLCNASMIITDDAYITFILQSNVTHIVSPDISNGETGSICLSTYVNSKVTITSDAGIATVLCTGTNLATRRGFAFSSMSFLKISNIKFEGCGGILSSPSLSFVNETIQTFFYFDACQPAALLFHKCNNLILSNIEVTNFLGFGVMLSNSLGHVVIQNMMVHDHIHHDDIIFPSYCNAIGSGILIMYNILDQQTIVDIINCTITNCYNNGQLSETLGTLRILSGKVTPDYWPKPVIGGSGLTGIFTYTMDQLTFVRINFNHLYVANNTGLEASAIVLLFMVGNFPVVRFNDLVTENNCVIDSGSEHYNVIGRSITAYISLMRFKVSVANASPISIIGSNFRMSNCGTLKEQGSTTEVLIVHSTHHQINVFIKNTKFNGITVSPTHGCGIALYVSKSIIPLAQNGMLFVQINNVTAYDIACIVQNGQNSVSSGSCYEVGIFSFANVGNVAISSGQFYNITGSSVITAMNSKVYLSQDPVFTNIKTESFGAINLILNSFLYFKEPLNAKFINNSAALGAAIYAVNDVLYNDLCVFQFDLLKCYDETNYTNMSIEIYVENNVADLAGNLIYASPIEKCLFDVKYFWPVPTLSSNIRNLSLLIKEIFKLQTFQNNSVSTTPAVICSCDPHSVSPQCINKSVSLTVYPGRNITIHVAAFDTNQQKSLYALINAQYHSYISISHEQLVTALQQGVCTNLPYTIFYSTNENTKYPIYDVHLGISLYAHTPQFYVNLTLTPCPDSFQPADGGTCQCVYSKFSDLICNIENGSVAHPPSSWIGLTENKTYGYSSECPPLYCIANLPAVDLSNPDSLCYGNRTGTLCGTCGNNLSAVFGTADCQECSNLYLLTILGYAIAGLLLVILLFVLELTITSGTINGLIFYANLIGSNQSYLNGRKSFLLYCISLINLELGFPLCFYNGMTQLVSTCLQFLFPVYIWIITVAIIYLSRYSIKLSRITGKRAVPVLVTLVYLSYSKIVTSIVNTFTVATIETVDGQKYLVWYLDGSLMYGHWPHIIPIILSLVMLILFVVPVTLLSTLAPFLGCIRLINRYMPLPDAVFAPYKNKWRFWFGLRIWLLMTALIITSFFRGNNCLAIQLVFVTGFSLVQAFIQPFKNTAIEILDLFFMVNFALVAFIVVYVENEMPILHYSAGKLVNMALVVFLCIIIFHFYEAVAKPLIKLCRKNKQGPVFLDAVNTSINYRSTKKNMQVTEVQVQDLKDDLLREPVLNFTDSYS